MKHFETETCHGEDFEIPEIGQIVEHKLYGKCRVFSVDSQSLMVVLYRRHEKEQFHEASLMDITFSSKRIDDGS